MSDCVIDVTNLSKSYLLRHRTSNARYVALRDVITDKVKSVGKRIVDPLKSRGTKTTVEEFWALNNVSFQINEGDRVGIIGKNGAGKSTLLKILSRITEPTKGRIRIKGRLASLLEVGTGFHPELTGRENIFLNGAILGMARSEITRKFDEIVAFAGVEKFLDTPVKRYSSGMYVRLAFAVAAHLEPEILVVDEVLAVGDAEFQKKCLGKMEDISKGGRTVLFVSHNMQSISSLTSKAIYMESGKVAKQGSTADVVSYYLSRNQSSNATYTAAPNPDRPNITKVEVVTSEPGGVHVNGKPIQFRFELTTPRPIKGACFSFNVVDQQMQRIVHMWTFDSELPMCRDKGTFSVVCDIPKFRLYMGQYSIRAYFSEPPGGDQFEVLDSVCPFEVAMYGIHREFQWQPNSCTYLEDGAWTVKQV